MSPKSEETLVHLRKQCQLLLEEIRAGQTGQKNNQQISELRAELKRNQDALLMESLLNSE